MPHAREDGRQALTDGFDALYRDLRRHLPPGDPIFEPDADAYLSLGHVITSGHVVVACGRVVYHVVTDEAGDVAVLVTREAPSGETESVAYQYGQPLEVDSAA